MLKSILVLATALSSASALAAPLPMFNCSGQHKFKNELRAFSVISIKFSNNKNRIAHVSEVDAKGKLWYQLVSGTPVKRSDHSPIANPTSLEGKAFRAQYVADYGKTATYTDDNGRIRTRNMFETYLTVDYVMNAGGMVTPVPGTGMYHDVVYGDVKGMNCVEVTDITVE